jgi:hypothetical protein
MNEQPPIEKRMQIENRKQQDFLDLAKRFRKATDPNEAKLLGNELGRMVFGGCRQYDQAWPWSSPNSTSA